MNEESNQARADALTVGGDIFGGDDVSNVGRQC
jgi:hypothetical protein